MRNRLLTGVLLVLVLSAAVTAACGSGSKKTAPGGGLVLVGTVIPTAPPATLTPAVCKPPAALSLPANFPADFPVPPDFVVWSVETSPHLHVEGRASPPPAANGEPPKGVVANALVTRGTAMGWQFATRNHIDGQDYMFVTPDGRTGHFNANQAPAGCEGQVILVLDADWVTG